MITWLGTPPILDEAPQDPPRAFRFANRHSPDNRFNPHARSLRLRELSKRSKKQQVDLLLEDSFMLTIYDSNSSRNSSQTPVPDNAMQCPQPGESNLHELRLMELDVRDEANIPLAPEESATLTSLISRYDQLLIEVDALNLRIEELLKCESPAAAKGHSR
jgi:hypothetical protein